MKILLVSPSVNPAEKTNKQMLMPQLVLFILQGLTPQEHGASSIRHMWGRSDAVRYWTVPVP